MLSFFISIIQNAKFLEIWISVHFAKERNYVQCNFGKENICGSFSQFESMEYYVYKFV